MQKRLEELELAAEEARCRILDAARAGDFDSVGKLTDFAAWLDRETDRELLRMAAEQDAAATSRLASRIAAARAFEKNFAALQLLLDANTAKNRACFMRWLGSRRLVRARPRPRGGRSTQRSIRRTSRRSARAGPHLDDADADLAFPAEAAS